MMMGTHSLHGSHAAAAAAAAVIELETGSGCYLTVPLQQQQHVGVSSLHTSTNT